MRTRKSILALLTVALICWPSFSSATSGCCSHHGGVCGCDSSVGRQLCCDGTDSPSCGCAYDPPASRTKTYSDLKSLAGTESSKCQADEAKLDECNRNLDSERNSSGEKSSRISSMERKISDLESKGWLSFSMLIAMFCCCVAMAFVASGCNDCKNRTIVSTVNVLLWIFVIFLMLGGCSHLHP